MTKKTGIANLPLHYGHVPSWLANRMAILGAVMTQAIVQHYGRDENRKRCQAPASKSVPGTSFFNL